MPDTWTTLRMCCWVSHSENMAHRHEHTMIWYHVLTCMIAETLETANEYGIYRYANGDIYEGDYKDGKKHGSGDVYEGG